MGGEMIAVMLKAMGVDPSAVMAQAQQLNIAFQAMAERQSAIAAQLTALQAGQDAIAAAMGIYVPPPSPEYLAIIDRESARFREAAPAMSGT